MKLHLVRHGEAAQSADDAQRALTPAGRAAVERLAERAARAGVAPVEIRHSGLLRARQTAEILAAALRPRRGVVASKGLCPNDDPADVAVELGVLDEPLMLVTHMPFVAALTARLLGSRGGAIVAPYDTAEMRVLERGPAGWTVVPS